MTHVVNLESFGVESAYDLERIRLYAIPTIDPDIVTELLQWRIEVEQGFTFKPEHGVTLADAGAAPEIVVRRFKISLARKVLSGSKQLAVLAETSETRLKRELEEFRSSAEQWTKVAKELRDFQSGRQPLERNVNRSPFWILGFSFGVPFGLWLLFLIFN
jgi:hypothetical protein